MLLTFFSTDYYLLSMSEVIQEIFKESSVNNSLKSVPKDSCTFSGKRQKMICVYLGLIIHGLVTNGTAKICCLGLILARF